MKRIIAFIQAIIIFASFGIVSLNVCAKEPYTAKITSGAKAGWIITTADYNAKENVERIADGNPKTVWHSPVTNPKTLPPFTIDITLPEAEETAGLIYTPRIGGDSTAGIVTEMEVYASDSDNGELKKIKTFVMENTEVIKELKFDSNITIKKFRLVVTEGNMGYGVIAEIDLIPKDGSLKDMNIADIVVTPEKRVKGHTAVVGSGPKAGWVITASHYNAKENVERLADGNTKTVWHSPVTTPKTMPPFTIDITLPEAENIAGLIYTPRIGGDSTAGIVTKMEVYASETEEDAFLPVGYFSMENTEEIKNLEFTKNIKVKDIRLVVTEGNMGYGVIAEMDLIPAKESFENTSVEAYSKGIKEEAKKEKGPYTVEIKDGPKKGWIITASHYDTEAGVKNIADGNASTVWHSPITTPKTLPPFTIDIVLPEISDISGLIYTPRTKDSQSGIITGMEVYVAENDEDEFTMVDLFKMEKSEEVKKLDFAANILVKKIRLVITEGYNGYGVIAELDLIPAMEGNKELAAGEIDEYRLYEMDKTHFKAFSNSVWREEFLAQNVFDASASGDNMWHYMPKDPKPIILDVDLGSEGDIAAFTYYPREKDLTGHWKTFNLLSSVDGENYTNVLTGAEIDSKSFEPVIFRFPDRVRARFFRFEIADGEGGHVACQEISFLQHKADRDNFYEENKEVYTLKIGSNEIISEKGNVKETVLSDVAPFIVGGTTLIPLRGLLERMGAEISWDGEVQKIGISKKGMNEITMQIENELVDVGGRRFTMTVAPRIVNSRTFIPLRFVSEHLGYDVAWDGATQTITITKPL